MRYVIDPAVALLLARTRAVVADDHRLLAPTLLRSDVLAQLYVDVRAGVLTKAEAGLQLDYLRGVKLRLLGDRVLQRRAWAVAEDLGWPDTRQAEYVALTLLQADALVTLDASLAAAVKGLVVVVGPEAVLPG